MTPLELRSRLIDAKKEYGQGRITVEQLYEHADAYIDALKAYAKRTGKKVPIPTPAHIIRALPA